MLTLERKFVPFNSHARSSNISFLQQTMYRLLIQPSYSIEDIHLAPIDHNQITLLSSGEDWGPDDSWSRCQCILLQPRVRKPAFYGVGLPKRMRLEEYSCYWCRCGRYALLWSAKQKHPGVPRFQIYSSPSGPRLPHNALAIKIVPRVHNMILDDSAMQPGASYLALAAASSSRSSWQAYDWCTVHALAPAWMVSSSYNADGGKKIAWT
jgi:hypothetical protein